MLSTRSNQNLCGVNTESVTQPFACPSLHLRREVDPCSGILRHSCSCCSTVYPQGSVLSKEACEEEQEAGSKVSQVANLGSPFRLPYLWTPPLGSESKLRQSQSLICCVLVNQVVTSSGRTAKRLEDTDHYQCSFGSPSDPASACLVDGGGGDRRHRELP